MVWEGMGYTGRKVEGVFFSWNSRRKIGSSLIHGTQASGKSEALFFFFCPWTILIRKKSKS